MAFILLGADDLVCVIHCLRLFQPPLGVAQGGGTYAILSDVTIMGATTVAAPATLLHCSPVLPIRTAAAIDVALAAATPCDQQLAPDAGIGDVRTRLGMLIPLAYVPAILQAVNSPGGLSPRGLWEVIIAPLWATARREAACQSFVDWARVAVSHVASATNPL